MVTGFRRSVIGEGWIALPYAIELTEAQAYSVFEAAGGWSTANVATEAA